MISKKHDPGNTPISRNLKWGKKHRHYLGFGGAFLSLLLSASVLASEIDWVKSNLVIHFSPEISGTLECFGESGNNLVKSLDELGLNDSNTTLVFEEGGNPCFRMAGTYNVSVELWDTAGNSSMQNHPPFVIKAADPDATNSSLAGTCTGQIADSVGACNFSLTLKDEFGNLVTQVDKVQVYSPTGDVSDQANKGLSFRNGLQMDGVSLPKTASTEFPKSGLSNGTGSLGLSALAPSVQWTHGTGATPSGTMSPPYLAKYKPQTLQFLVNAPSIANDGTVENNFAVSNLIDRSVETQFIPPFQITPTIADDTYIEIDVPFDVDFKLDAVEQAPAQLNLFSQVEAVGVTNLERHNFDDENGVSTLHETLRYNNLTGKISTLPTSYIESPRITSAENDINTNFSVISMISYVLGGKTIQYPAGGLGTAEVLGVVDEVDPNNPINIVGYANDSAEVLILGFTVEGGALRGKDGDTMFLLEGGTGDQMAYIGAIDETDIRSAVSRNAFELLRGADATAFTADDHVVVKEGNVILSDIIDGNTAPTGRNTLVIKNGNLIIDQDLEYANVKTDSFGVMLINDATTAKPTTGNIFVKSNVQKIVGTYYADGGIMANDSTDATSGNGTINKKQLLLTGMLLTKNTKGGSVTLSDSGNYFTPWGEGTKSEAKIYDLDYIRRYNSKTPEGKIDDNPASFVLRMDKKASELPPPGFEITGTIQQ